MASNFGFIENFWLIIAKIRRGLFTKFLSPLILKLRYDACSAHAHDYRLIYADDVICVGKSCAFARAVMK